jgi:hypothetical protein
MNTEQYLKAKQAFLELQPKYIEAGALVHDVMMDLWAAKLQEAFGCPLEHEKIVVEVTGKDDFDSNSDKLIAKLKELGIQPKKLIQDKTIKKILVIV